MKIINLEQNTPEWKEYRKSHFNASETSVLFGCGFYDELTLAHIKFKDFEIYQNMAMKKGSKLEAQNRQTINDALKKDFKSLVCVYEEDERFSASLDGYDENTNEILELKLSLDEFSYICENKKPSEKYMYQIQHQLMCSEAKMCYFVAFEPFGDYAMCEVMPDKKVQKEIVKKWLEFDKKYRGKELKELEKNIDESDQNADFIAKIVDEAITLKEQINALNEKLKEKENYLRDIGAQTKTRFFNKILYYKTQRQTCDYKSYLKDNNLELPEKYVKNSVSWALKYTNA